MSDLDELISAAGRHRWHLSLVRMSDGEWRCAIEWGHRTGTAEAVVAEGRSAQEVARQILEQLRQRGKLKA